jgi:DNA-directed RNA polymerase specialized sigma24 family protein
MAAVASPDSDERRSGFETLTTVYWKPVFKYIRLKWRAEPEDAADLTQSFFLRAFEKEYFRSFDPGKARFRTFLRTCVDRFVANSRKSDRRLKRGGAIAFVGLDVDAAERELARQASDPVADFDAYFHREWIRSLFALAVERLRDACASRDRLERFAVFERYDLADEDSARPTYAVLARQFGVSSTDVTNELAAARREFRRYVLDILREQCATDEEFAVEARALAGGRP